MENEIDYYGALGLEAPEEGSGENTGDAAPATQEPSGGGEQGSAGPANQDPQEGAQGQQEPPEGGQAPQENQGQEPPAGEQPAQEPSGGEHEQEGQEPQARQSRKEDARFAAMRRQAEADARKRAEGLIAGLGVTDPFTGVPITTFEQAEAFRARQVEDQRKRFMEANGLTQQQYDQFVGDLPEVRQAREQAQQIQAQAVQAQLDQELRDLQRLDPTVKTLEDLEGKPKHGDFCGYVRKGLTLSDAYRLTYGDELLTRQAAAAKQAAINDLRGKEHLEATGQRGTGAVSVPADVREQYRLFNPEATEEEVQSAYNEYLKKTQG